MQRIHPKLYQSYERWTKELGDTDYPKDQECVTVDTVLCAHYLLCDYFSKEGEPIAAAGPRDKTLLLSAIDRQVMGFGGQSKWQNVFERSATLFYGLVKNHPFHDGNKRTGLLAALYQLVINKRTPTGKQRDFEQLAVDTAAGTLRQYSRFSRFKKGDDAEVRFIADFFRNHTRKEDKQLYVITFNQLRKILGQHGFQIEGPQDNHIDVVRYDTKSTLFGIKKKEVRTLVAQVGCPRMTAEINQKALKTILKNTGLTPENGYDSQVFFKDASPLDALIDVYNEPLRRLRDK